MSTVQESFEIVPSAEPDETGYIYLPLLVVADQIIFPKILTPYEPTDETIDIIRDAIENQQTVIAINRFDDEILEEIEEHDFAVGIEVAIGRMPFADETDMSTVLLQGRRRVGITHLDTDADEYVIAEADVLQDKVIDLEEVDDQSNLVVELFIQYADFNEHIPDDVIEHVRNLEDVGELCDIVASTISLSLTERQELLETLVIDKRIKLLVHIMQHELERLDVEDELNSQIQQEITRNQREVILREQMRIIQSELGEADVFQEETNDLKEQIQALGLPAEAHDKAMKELSRLAMMPPMSPETGIIRTYLDWIISLPWNNESDDKLDVLQSQKVLDEDHYGLKKVKDRILEHIAVRKLAKGDMKSPILCFVGPPGVGKTSIGQSIARALGREFARVSLGGVRDEAEIRGHRRTYIGALPGRIIQTMKRVGTSNPVIMLDEIDKLGADFRGDPSSALLEVLDPEQNYTFTDHYLELPFDLSKVLFITTANDLFSMPEALEDRLEVIEFRGYTEEEKVAIAQQYLIPKQLKATGLEEHPIRFEAGALQTIIRQYTHESGVRNLEREIANVCRKVARLVASNKRYPKRITGKMVSQLLGPPYFSLTHVNRENTIGLVTGLVWTSGGGDVQSIEVSLVPGKGNVTMTGQLGDVLQESAQTAMSYVRSRASENLIPHDDFENYDLHIHLPEGAVPKDGPSAGITLATAMMSIFTERKVRSDYAMTGEMTLRGNVLPVGGIKEKVLAARRNLITKIIIPNENSKDLEEIPKHALKDLDITFVDHIQEVLDLVLEEAPERRLRDIEREKQEAEIEDD